MTTEAQTMPDHSEALATAAHLHVLLRRKTGRVTDTEWMATNAAYAVAIVEFTRSKAREEGLPELLPWADKLEASIPGMGALARKPLLAAAVDRCRATQRDAAQDAPVGERKPSGQRISGFRESSLEAVAPPATVQRYVGGIR